MNKNEDEDALLTFIHLETKPFIPYSFTFPFQLFSHFIAHIVIVSIRLNIIDDLMDRFVGYDTCQVEDES